MAKTYTFKRMSFTKYHGEESRVGDVELTVDWQSLAYELGRKAAFNKNGKSGMRIGLRAKFIPAKQ